MRKTRKIVSFPPDAHFSEELKFRRYYNLLQHPPRGLNLNISERERSSTIDFISVFDRSALSLKVRLRLTTPETKRISIDNRVTGKSSD